MFVVHDQDTQSIIGPFNTGEDAVSFMTKVEEMSQYNFSLIEVYDVQEPNEWIHDNMDNILMANC
jgi:hypothetical protein